MARSKISLTSLTFCARVMTLFLLFTRAQNVIVSRFDSYCLLIVSFVCQDQSISSVYYFHCRMRFFRLFHSRYIGVSYVVICLTTTSYTRRHVPVLPLVRCQKITFTSCSMVRDDLSCGNSFMVLNMGGQETFRRIIGSSLLRWLFSVDDHIRWLELERYNHSYSLTRKAMIVGLSI